MNIHFTKQFPWGEPTYFIEKIWTGFAVNEFLWNERDGENSPEPFQDKWPYDYEYFKIFMKAKPKLHTIREDKNDRWKAGIPIHFQQWTDKPYKSKCYHFAPVIPCMGVQKIEINWQTSHKHKSLGASVFIDNRFLYMPEIKVLAKNDGFDSIEDFFKWFDKDFTGKIVHWTDLKY